MDRINEKLYLSRKGFFEKVLNWFSMNDGKPTFTPLATKFKLSRI